MTPLLDVRHVSISIQRPPVEVYRFARDGNNLAKWASGLGDQKVEGKGDDWSAHGPLGDVKIHFAAENAFGVLDHDVTLPNGTVVHNPLRVMPNGDGSTVVFSVLQQPGMKADAFANDVKHVEKDLMTLKSLLEKKS